MTRWKILYRLRYPEEPTFSLIFNIFLEKKLNKEILVLFMKGFDCWAVLSAN